jgi:hypothetical protein
MVEGELRLLSQTHIIDYWSLLMNALFIFSYCTDLYYINGVVIKQIQALVKTK